MNRKRHLSWNAARVAATVRHLLFGLALAMAAGAAAAGVATAQQEPQEGPRILSPAPGETVHSNAGRVPVVIGGAAPELRFRPVLDGKPATEPSESPTFSLVGVERGTHQLAVALIAPDGKEVGRTETVEFHVFHASRLLPARRDGR